MASIIEELIITLEEEDTEYEKLLKLSKEKTDVIVSGDVERLREMVAQEQIHTDKLAALEAKRETVVKDIATVLNKDVNTLTVKKIIELLNGQEEIQDRLSRIHDSLRSTLKDMVVVNDMNKELIQTSLELVEFDINYLNGMRQMPEVSNYNKRAYNDTISYGISSFDKKN